MSAATLVTVEAYGILDLPPAIRDRVIERERTAAWETWMHSEVAEQLADGIAERIDGVEDVRVTAWSILDGGRGSMVVEGTLVDPDAFATSLGLAGHDVRLGLTLDPHHANSSRWAGTTYVIRHDHDGPERDDVMSEALGDVIGDVLDTVAGWAEGVTSDDAIAESLDAAGWWYDRLGRDLDPVIVDEVTS